MRDDLATPLLHRKLYQVRLLLQQLDCSVETVICLAESGGCYFLGRSGCSRKRTMSVAPAAAAKKLL